MTVRWRFTYYTILALAWKCHTPSCRNSACFVGLATPPTVCLERTIGEHYDTVYDLYFSSRRHGTNSLGNWKVICVMMLYYVSTTRKKFTNTVTLLWNECNVPRLYHHTNSQILLHHRDTSRGACVLLWYHTLQSAKKKHQWSSKLHHYDLGVFLFCCSSSSYTLK